MPSSIYSPMDRTNLEHGRINEGGFQCGFPPPSPSHSIPPSSFPSVSASGKPSPAPGLSKPRLVKLRKHFTSPRVKQAVVPETGVGSDFNPFRSDPPVAVPPERSDDGGTRVLREELHSWNQFVPKAGGKVPENSRNPKSGSFEFGKLENAAFVFGAGSVSNSNSKNVGSGISFGSEISGNSDAGGFVFGSGVKKGSNLSWKSSGNSSGQSLGSFESVKSESTEFVFGASSVSDSNTKNIGLGKLSGDSFSFTSEGSGNFDSGAFVFGSSVKKSANWSLNSSIGSNKGSFSKLPDEIRKLNLENAGNGDGFEKTTNADNWSKVDDTSTFIYGSSSMKKLSGEMGKSDSVAFVFGSDAKKTTNLSQNSSFGYNEGSVKKLPEEMKKSDSGAFVFGSGVKKTTNLSQKSSFGSDKLPDEMRKLNIENAGNGDRFEKTTHADDRSKVDENNSFIFGSSSVKKLLVEMKKSDSSAFVFGSGVKKSTNLSQKSSFGSDEDSFSKLPDEMRKLNLENAGNGDCFEKTTHADDRSKVDDNNSFIFGSSSAKKLPEEMKKLNIRSGSESQTMKSENSDFAADVFVFGNSVKKSSVSSQASAIPFTDFDKSPASELPDDRQKLSTGGFEKAKETGCREKADLSNGFVFGSSGTVSGSFGGSAVNTLHDDMEKLNISSKTENSVDSTPFKFSFQAGKQDHSSSMGPTTTEAPSSHPSSIHPGFQSVGTEFTFTGMHGGSETPHKEFRTPKQNASRLPMENLFMGTHHDRAFSMKKGEVKGTRTKKKIGKSRQSAPVHQSCAKQFVFMEMGSQENPELDPAGGYSPELDPAGGYSPMDYSPYQDNLVPDQYSREASVASDESTHFISRCVSTDTQKSVSVDKREEELVSAAQPMEINEGNIDLEELDGNGSEYHVKRSFTAESSFVDEQTSGFKESHMSNYENGLDSVSRTAPVEAEAGPFSSNIERQASEGGTEFTFSSTVEDFGASNFTSPSVQGPLSSSKRTYRRKSRRKAGQDSHHSTPNANVPSASPSPNLFPLASSSVHLDPAQGQKCISFVNQTDGDNRAGKSKESAASQESTITATACVAAQEACEKWRLRGNQAYENGHLSKAEDYYTRGVNCLSLKEASRSFIRPLTLCYSNRAATRMSLGRMREALNDCKMAVAIDPNFLRAQVRAGNCHLALGEIGDALKNFKECLQSTNDINSDQQILIDASDGLQKAQQVSDLAGQAAELLLKKTSNDAMRALQIISEALTISPHSESLFEMKAEALLMLRSYEEVIQLCEQTLDLAERNSVETETDAQCKDVDNSEYMKISPVRLWRWRLISKSYFYLGKLEDALELLQKHEKLKPVADKYDNRSPESSTSFAVTVHELLRLKAAGNEAFQAGRHSEAVEFYTAALVCNTESRPFAAICFCNRAAAYQALGQITDAIADCSLAIALDANYLKAISRRATLHEMIRDYGQAANDLRRLISLLEKQLEDNQYGAMGRSTGNSSDLKRARVRLSTVEEEARKETSLDMYKILGIERSCSASDVKKAYRKAALRHHPDKAGQFLARSENAEDGLWREVADEVHMDSDRLFKMIGEAYTTLSDPTKRLQYDAEEEMRTTLKKGYNGTSTPKTPPDSYSSQYEKSVNRRHWRAHGSSHQRW